MIVLNFELKEQIKKILMRFWKNVRENFNPLLN